jgi:hypothetical protein
VPLGIAAGFTCPAVMINTQAFTKTSHIWGVDNMGCGTNTNRIILFKKGPQPGIHCFLGYFLKKSDR